MSKYEPIKRKRIIILVYLALLIPIGFLAKFYRGPGFYIISNKIAGSLYVLFWCLLVSLIIPKAKKLSVVIAVLLVTSLLEFLQLYNSVLLNSIRTSFIGRVLIGVTFSWSDLIFYIIGAMLALYSLKRIDNNMKV